MDSTNVRHSLAHAVRQPCHLRAFRLVSRFHAQLRRPQAAFSVDALESLRHARKEASRQGSMFAGCDHLLLGITGSPSSTAAKLLRDHGLDSASMRATLDAARVMLSSAYMQASDVDFAPDARSALSVAVAASQAAGKNRIGSFASLSNSPVPHRKQPSISAQQRLRVL